MAIKEITKAEVHFVETDEEDYYKYTRYSATNWTVVMGESDEPVYDCEELEAEFQRALAESSIEYKVALPLQNVTNSALILKVQKLEAENKLLSFMVENGLGEEDMLNDITLPHDI